ncbi:MAG: prepilin-type N-terminal cleavage/methylation domain-containing protein [Verrucomicrobiae bacterium]|nr:prepilin-type N-terminal cleavage/methylation domain-containing protein [Verrucomicrobiae bacterium]
MEAIRRPDAFTLAEMLIAMGVCAIGILGVFSGFVFLQKASVHAAYNTGAQRVAQEHLERAMAVNIDELRNNPTATYVNFNYSGLRITTTANTNSQSSLTNAATRQFDIQMGYQNGTATGAVTYSRATEDAVLAYLTRITVSPVTRNRSFTNLAGVSPAAVDQQRFYRINVDVYWSNKNKNFTNSVSAMRPEL